MALKTVKSRMVYHCVAGKQEASPVCRTLGEEWRAGKRVSPETGTNLSILSDHSLGRDKSGISASDPIVREHRLRL
jgi:hypothetical protein